MASPCFSSSQLNTQHPNSTHGGRHTAEYQIWMGMRRRCYDSSRKEFARYGAIGISVCQRWTEFINFYKDMGPRPSRKHSIERRDRNGDYSPINCYWATPQQQQRNRSNTRLVEFRGRLISVAELSELSGIDYHNLWNDIKRGLSAEYAVSRKRRHSPRKVD